MSTAPPSQSPAQAKNKKDRKLGLKALKACFMLVLGFAGGFLSLVFVYWSKPLWATVAIDGVAIANTYIVFTTFLFVGFTVLLAVAGILFAQEFSRSKESHLLEALEHMCGGIHKDEKLSTKLVESILGSVEGRRFLEEKLESKIDELITQRSHTLRQSAEAAERLTESRSQRTGGAQGKSPWTHGPEQHGTSENTNGSRR